MKIAVLLDHYFLPVREAIGQAARAGFEGVQIYTTAGELAPENLSRSGQRELLRLLADHRLVLSALCADLGGPRFADSATVDTRVTRTCRIIEQAAELRVPVVTAHVGTISSKPEDPSRRQIAEAVDAVGAVADRAGVIFAIETGQEAPAVLAEFIAGFNNSALGVNYDPANLLMNGFDALAGVAVLANYIRYVHAKDSVGGEGRVGREVPLGQGGVNYPEFARALESAGYTGWHTVERKHAQTPVAELAAACEYLRSLRSR
ncbi:MAG: sugar phosphate isomerase/epimerase [Phycisphaerae bacterium]|nr:sugar phosphate isomerase/epimerase [Phycisphaerae bacterium]